MSGLIWTGFFWGEKNQRERKGRYGWPSALAEPAQRFEILSKGNAALHSQYIVPSTGLVLGPESECLSCNAMMYFVLNLQCCSKCIALHFLHWTAVLQCCSVVVSQCFTQCWVLQCHSVSLSVKCYSVTVYKCWSWSVVVFQCFTQCYSVVVLQCCNFTMLQCTSVEVEVL